MDELKQEAHRMAEERARLARLHRDAVAMTDKITADRIQARLVTLDRKMGWIAELMERDSSKK